MKKHLLSFLLLFIATMSYAQIGYQVSLLNTATGEPRANETVSCVIELTNSEGTVICSETKTATSNDFGVISLTVGNEKTFENMDWNKLPLFVSVTIGGKLIGQSQVLTVPVAEYAKKTGTLTYENIGQKRIIADERVHLTFVPNSHTVILRDDYDEYEGEYYIDGNAIWVSVNGGGATCGHYIQEIDAIIVIV